MPVEVKLNQRAFNLLEQLPLEVQGRVGAKAITSGARVVRKALRSKLPDSRKTGTRKKWSKATAAKYGSYKPMKQGIKVYNLFRKGVVGAKVWAPGLAWMEFGFTNKLWGNPREMKMAANPLFRRTIDSTRRKQQTAIVKVLVKEFRKLEARAK